MCQGQPVAQYFPASGFLHPRLGHALRKERRTVVGRVRPPVTGCSVLTHEQVVDLLRDLQLRPLMLKRVPSASEGDLRKAHAYAYGGSLVLEFRAVA
jgi:hypothetical protein